MKPTARTYIQIAIAAALGAGYGLWGLEAASPLAIPLLLWAVLVLLLVWRMPPRFGLFIGYAADMQRPSSLALERYGQPCWVI
jgi:hypothetical protein